MKLKFWLVTAIVTLIASKRGVTALVALPAPKGGKAVPQRLAEVDVRVAGQHAY